MNTHTSNAEQPERVRRSTLLGQATATQLSNDLYWRFYPSGCEKPVRWSGYNDGYWWAKVSTSEQFQVQEHEGKQYRLNPETNDVTLLAERFRPATAGGRP